MWSFDECKVKCRYYLQKIIDLAPGTELLSTLQASCEVCMEGFEARCQTADALRQFKTELGLAKEAYVPTIDYYARRKGDAWSDPHKPKLPAAKVPTHEEIKKLAEERKLVEPYLSACLMFIDKMTDRATTNEPESTAVFGDGVGAAQTERIQELLGALRRL